jgi:hypothetical protein
MTKDEVREVVAETTADPDAGAGDVWVAQLV